MNESPYYPPRARWHSRAFRFWWRIESWLVYREAGRALSTLLTRRLPAFLIPGFGIWLTGNRPKGRAIFGVFWMCCVIFLIELGHSLAGWMLGLMIGLHAISSWIYLAWVAPLPETGLRVMRMAVLVVFYSLIYLVPIQWVLTRYAFLPLEVEGQVCIVNPRIPLSRVQRGEWIAYDRPNISIPGYLLRAGPQLAKVYGLPGDRFLYHSGYFEIHSTASSSAFSLTSAGRYPSWPGMPQAGENVVDQNELFVWPRLINLSRYSGSVLRQFTELEQQFAYANSRVQRDQYRGRIYRWWFWRRQTMS